MAGIYHYADPAWHTPGLGYKPDRTGFRRFMTSSMLSALCVREALKGEAYAESIAPVETGHYKASFRVRAAMVDVGGEQRAGAILENTADYAIFVEAHFKVLQRSIDTIERG